MLALKEPADVVAMVPYLIGFTPVESLVVLALQGPRRRLGPCMRVDLADDRDGAEVQGRYLGDLIAAHGFSPVILVAYSVDAARADAVVQPLRRGLARRRVQVIEALRADGRRWWSYDCDDAECCSPRGSAYDAESSRVAAEAVLAGLHKAPDRDSLRVQFEPISRDAQVAVAEECDRLRSADLAVTRVPRDVPELDRLVALHRARPTEMPVTDAAALLLAVQRTALRDAAWALMNRANAAEYFGLWRWVMQTAPDDLMAPAGALTGFAAWLDGQGASASHVVDRVELVSPGYSMCTLLRDILEATVNPDVWSGFPLLREPTHG